MRSPPFLSFLRKRETSGRLDARFRGHDDKGPGHWMPASAGMTTRDLAAWVPAFAGMTTRDQASVSPAWRLSACMPCCSPPFCCGCTERRPPWMRPQKSGEVELVLEEQQGSGPTTAPPEPAPSAPVPPPRRRSPCRQPRRHLPAETAQEALPLPPPPVPPPAPAPSVPRQGRPPVQRAPEAPEINLGGNDSRDQRHRHRAARDPGQRGCKVPEPGAGLSSGGGAPCRAGRGDPG